MNSSYITPLYGYLACRKTKKDTLMLRILKQFICENKRCYTTIKPFYSIQHENSKILNKYQPIFCRRKNYSTHHGPRKQLMDMEIAVAPTFVNSIKKTLNSVIIKNFDNEFNMPDFIENSKTALSVVTKLLSESKFSDLDGLLSDECRAEVEKNVRAMESIQRYDLAVNIDDIFFSFPYEASIIKDNNNEEKTFFQITVVYHVCKNFSNLMKSDSWQAIAVRKLETILVYNCRFYREFTQGVEDQWIITGINFCKLGENFATEN